MKQALRSQPLPSSNQNTVSSGSNQEHDSYVEDPQIVLNNALDLLDSGYTKKAISQLEDNLRSTLENADSTALLVTLFIEEGNFIKASRLAYDGLMAHPSSVELRKLLANQVCNI